METIALNSLLVRLLILALHLAPQEAVESSIHVLQEGLYSGTYRVERVGEGHFRFRQELGEQPLPEFEIERSRRFAHVYTVHRPATGEAVSVGLADHLAELGSFAGNGGRRLEGGGTPLRVDFSGRLLFVGSEGEKISVITEARVSK